MTTREEIIDLRNECDEFAEQTLQCKGEFHPDFHTVSDERFYTIAFEAGAASRDAEIVELKRQLTSLQGSFKAEQKVAEKSETDAFLYAHEIVQLRAELVKALVACRAKDDALEQIADDDYDGSPIEIAKKALAIRPDDSALKAWLGEPIGRVTFLHHRKAPDVDWAVGRLIEKGMALYSPKELK